MHQYYLRRIVDGLLDSQRSKALASVVPHPQLQALQDAAGDQSGQGSFIAPALPAVSRSSSSFSSSSEDRSSTSSSSADNTSSPGLSSAAAPMPSNADLQCQATSTEASQPDCVATNRQAAEHSSLSNQRQHRKRKACDLSHSSEHSPTNDISGRDCCQHSDPGVDVKAANGSREAGNSELASSPLCLAAMQLLAAAVSDALDGQPDGQPASGRLELARDNCTLLDHLEIRSLPACMHIHEQQSGS